MRTRKHVLLILAGVVPLYAAEQGGITVRGSLNQEVTTGNNVNAAQGNNATAKQSIGVYEGHLSGQLSRTIHTGDNINTAVGQGAFSEKSIGVVRGK